MKGGRAGGSREAREGAGRGEEVVSTILCKGGGRGGEPRAGPRAGTRAVCSGRRARASMLWECGRLRGLEMRAGLACCGKGSCIEAKREGRDMFARRRDTKSPVGRARVLQLRERLLSENCGKEKGV